MSEKRIVFEVKCLDRQLIIDIDENYTEAVNNIFQERYDVWKQYTDEDVQCQCCEEYMLEGLSNNNISYKEIAFVHVLISEWNGIQDNVEVFQNEEDMIDRFCELSKVSWENYLNGDYKFTEGETFYRCFTSELK